MPSSEPRYHKIRDYWYCSHPTTGKQVYLGKDRNTAWRRFAALDDQPSDRPTFVADAVEAWKATHGGSWEAEELREWQGVKRQLPVPVDDNYSSRKSAIISHIPLSFCFFFFL